MNEKEFVKELKDYFTEIEWTDHAEKKISGLLADYLDENMLTDHSVIEKPLVLYKNKVGRPKTSEEGLVRIANRMARKICYNYNISIDELKRKDVVPKTGALRRRRSTGIIASAREEFIRECLVNSRYVSDGFYARFLNIDRTTVLYYRNKALKKYEKQL